MPNQITKRPPVVVIMGHIDHGKSTLLDFIRTTNVVDKEAGGITQHISAYEAVVDADGIKRTITFIDTPGHEAFKSMRSSGSSAADIAILVVSSEDGVKPQTKEAIQWILSNELPFIVAFTKIDRPGANVELAKQSLAEANVYVEGYGGDIPWVAVSGKTGDGVKDLLDTILLITDVNNIHDENPTITRGIVIESHRDPKKGVTATAILKNGTLVKKGFAATMGAFTPLRIVENFSGKQVEEIHAGSPVRIIGWSNAPIVGSEFLVYENKDDAIKASELEIITKSEDAPISLEKKQIPLILRADTSGSLEALKYEIAKFTHERVAPKIILAGIGNINESDVKTAQSDKESVLVAFHTNIDPSAKSLAERLSIVIVSNDIIYKLIEDVFAEIEKRAPRITVETIGGVGRIVRVFSKNKDKQIVGGKVLSGTIKLNAQVKILRRETKIAVGKIKEMQYLKERINEAIEGREFGAMIESKMEIVVGDEIQAFEFEETQ